MDSTMKEKKNKTSSSDEDIPTTNRRMRTVMSSYQSKVLQEYFAQNPFPSTELREELSRTLKMRPRTIQIWFQNQRQKKKNNKEYYPHYTKEYMDDYKRLNILASVAASLYFKKQEDDKNKKSHC